MKSNKKAINQLHALCRQYPGKLTPLEIVGWTYLMIHEALPSQDWSSFLADHLGRKELAKLTDAAAEVLRTADPKCKGFQLGALVVPVDRNLNAPLRDQWIPAEFVKQLIRCRPSATGRSA